MNSGTATPAIRDLIDRTLSATNRHGEYDINDQRKRQILIESGFRFSREAAIILKDYELRNAYILIKSLAEEEEAKKQFGHTNPQTIREYHFNQAPRELVHQQFANVSTEFSFIIQFCGGTLPNQGFGGNISMRNMSFGEFRNYIARGPKETFNCPGCQGEIESGKGITTCPHCGLTKEKAGSKCD